MRKSRGNTIRLGVFVSISALLFITAIYMVGQRRQMFSRTFHLSGIFSDINGLQVGNNVRFSGINVGIVENIFQVTDSTVQVDMRIAEKNRRFIRKNASAIIGTDGLIGSRILEILPGTATMELISDYDTIQTFQPITMDDILLNLKVTSDNAVVITEDLAVIMDNIREGRGIIGKMISDSAFANDADLALENIKQGAGGFKQNMDAASHNFLLKGYLKKKEKEALKAEEDQKKQEQKEKRNK